MIGTIRRLGFALVWLAATSCTFGRQAAPSGPSPSVPSGPASPTRSFPAEPARAALTLPVVADLSPQVGSLGFPNPYLDGARLAVREVNASGGVRGRPLALALRDAAGGAGTNQIRDLLSGPLPPAILYQGPGQALLADRVDLERTGTPVLMLGGDLYTSRRLFRQVFQASVPWEWQIHAIARYVVRDRHAGDVVFIGSGPGGSSDLAATRAALAYWGGRLAAGFTDASKDPGTGWSRALERAGRADWAIVDAPPGEVLELVNGIEEVEGSTPPGITASTGLLVPVPGLANPDPGRSACYTYTWAGWATPIPRAGGFAGRFRAAFGRTSLGLEQEGYDAVRLLADGLRGTAGRGGSALTAELETVRNRAYSSLPVDLGPDDHVLPPRDQLGLFAVPGPAERLDPWQRADDGPPYWRPVMRTFTYDGRRDSILDRDRRVFFPFWRANRPGPYYWQSRYGIVSRPTDRVH